MSWQQNIVLQCTYGAPAQEERDSGPQGDSRILRYIKTLTSHQTNAKQQRMDRYLQQVKHTQPVKEYDVKGWQSCRQPTAKKSLNASNATTVNGETPRREKLPRSNAAMQSHRGVHGKKLTNSRKDTSMPLKRSDDGKPSHRQQKKLKRAPNQQQIAVIESLDRFSFKGAGPQDNPQASEYSNKMLAPTGNKTAQQSQAQLSTRTADPVFKTIIDLGQRGTKEKYPDEVLKPLPPKASTTPSAAQDPWNNSIQHIFHSSEEKQQGNHDCALQEEVFVTAYDPLSATMQSIYF